MVRQLLAVLAGFTVCQVSTVGSLLLGTLLLAAVQGAGLGVQIAVLVFVMLLLLLPGLMGGALTGFLGRRRGWLYGSLAAFLFALSIAGVQAVAAPLLGAQYSALQIPPVFVSLILTVLAFTGALGGFLGQRSYIMLRARQQTRRTPAIQPRSAA